MVKKKQTGIRVPVTTIARLDKLCKKVIRDRTYIINLALEQYLKREGV
jgi:predicted transcriptional regulator